MRRRQPEGRRRLLADLPDHPRRTGLSFGLTRLVRKAAPFAGLLWLLGATAACEREPLGFRGVRLGMSPRDVRDRYTQPCPGQFSVDDGAPGAMALSWEASCGKARFEFHAGMLVAIRANVPADDPLAKGDAVSVLPTYVIGRAPDGEGVGLRILARDCPDHADEVRLLTDTAPGK